MPTRRPTAGRSPLARQSTTRRSLLALSASVLLLASLAPAGASALNFATSDGTPRLSAGGAQLSGGDASLRGRLKQLIRAARAGTLGSGAYLGLETARVPSGPGVAVALHLAPVGGERALASLVALGARVANRNGADVEAYLPLAALESLDGAVGIDRAEAIIRPIPLGTGLGQVGEGVALHGADVWQAAGITGAGVKVGIIDGGFMGLTARLGSELPATVHARCYREIGLYSSTAKSCEDFTEHGTAVAETISDMAPGISLYLADPLSSQDLFSTVAWMTGEGVKVINVSLGFAFEGPGDASASQPGSVYAAVDQAAQGGALWVNSAGNAGENGWTGTWKDADHDGLMEFSGTDESNSIVLAAGDTVVITMRWNDPWGHSSNDYDLYVYGANTGVPLASSEDTQDGTGDPVESLSFTPAQSGSYRLVIERAGGTSASKIQLMVLTSEDSPLEYRVPAGTLPSPADSANAGEVTVGAVAFDDPSTIETYSSRGPTPDGRIKPDIVAADCTTTSLLSPFCGTSDSAPYVTGAAALVIAARPSLSPPQLADWLRNHAVPLGSPIPNSTFGFGRLALGTPPVPPTATTLAFTSQPSVVVAQAPILPPIAVTIRDQDGLVLSTGPGVTSPVTLALGVAPVDGILDCPGGLTQSAAAGVATFAGCTISTSGPGVTLIATSGGLPSVSSVPFTVLPVGAAPTPTLATTASATPITWGTGVTLRGQLSLPGGAPATSIAGRPVTFEASADGTVWHAIGQGTTDDLGTASFAYRPVTNLYYRTTFAGAPDLVGAIGSSARVTVRQTASMRPSNGGLTRTIAHGRSITFTTTVRPARSDVPAGKVTFEIYRLVGSGWQRMVTQTEAPSSAGVAGIVVTFNLPGTWYVRSMAAPTKLNANSLWTPQEQFRVT